MWVCIRCEKAGERGRTRAHRTAQCGYIRCERCGEAQGCARILWLDSAPYEESAGERRARASHTNWPPKSAWEWMLED